MLAPRLPMRDAGDLHTPPPTSSWASAMLWLDDGMVALSIASCLRHRFAPLRVDQRGPAGATTRGRGPIAAAAALSAAHGCLSHHLSSTRSRRFASIRRRVKFRPGGLPSSCQGPRFGCLPWATPTRDHRRPRRRKRGGERSGGCSRRNDCTSRSIPGLHGTCESPSRSLLASPAPGPASSGRDLVPRGPVEGQRGRAAALE